MRPHMISIPEELFEQVERGNVLLFVGERIVRDADGGMAISQLTAQLAARGGLPAAEDTSFPEAAQLYEDTALIKAVFDAKIYHSMCSLVQANEHGIIERISCHEPHRPPPRHRP
jgi:hypothetical protein